MSERVSRLAPGRPHSPTARHCADRSAQQYRMRPPFLSPTGVEKGHGPCSPQTAATMDVRVTTATLLSSAHGCKRPMLPVHGFLATRRVVGSLASRLRRLGYCPHGVDRVEQLAREHRWERIDLVGHSEGGLIGRYYIQKLDGARRVRHLVTLGTLHRGTRWAYSGHLVRHVLPSLRQMAPGSPLLRDLANDSFPASVRLTSISSQRDSICAPLSCRGGAFSIRCGAASSTPATSHLKHMLTRSRRRSATSSALRSATRACSSLNAR
jgi:pimeloyl-ACP methyl ester carboxylesterase